MKQNMDNSWTDKLKEKMAGYTETPADDVWGGGKCAEEPASLPTKEVSDGSLRGFFRPSEWQLLPPVFC